MASQYGGDIRYGIKFDYDKSGLNGIKTSLQEVNNIANNLLKGINPTGLNLAEKEIKDIISTVGHLETAFNQAFNPQLGTINIQTFNRAIANSGVSLSQIQAKMAQLGPAGTTAFRKMSAELMTTNMQLKQSSTLLNKIGDTFANTLRWTLASTAINSVSSSIRKCYSYSKELDESLNNIMLVTDKSADSMEKFARQANKAAKNLGATTTEYTNASLIYYQQGLSDAETAARTEVTLKAANVTKQSADAVSEQLTAVWNGYKVSAQETELYIDKLAKVAASTASDLEELSVGMSRVASAANLMGVDVDQLNAQLATIISVTREAPETIGTSLKTIFARMSDIEAGLDEETTLGEYTQGMADLGFNVLDANYKLRDMGDVIEEIGGKWTSMSREQQVSLAQTMAGTRQYSRLLSLFDNWSMYEKTLKESANSAGFLQEQQEEYMKSMEAHLNQLKVATEGLMDSLFETESFNDVIDGLTTIVTLIDHFVQGIGGGGTAFIGLFSLLIHSLTPQLTQGISRIATNMSISKQEAAALVANQELLNSLTNTNDKTIQEMVKMKQQMLDLNHVLTDEERQLGDALIRQLDQQTAIVEKEKERQAILANTVKNYTGKTLGTDSTEDIKAALVTAEENLKTLSSTSSSSYIGQMKKAMSTGEGAQAEAVRLRKEIYAVKNSSGLSQKQKIQTIDPLKVQRDAYNKQAFDTTAIETTKRAVQDLTTNMSNVPEIEAAVQALDKYSKVVEKSGHGSKAAQTEYLKVESALKKLGKVSPEIREALMNVDKGMDNTANTAQQMADKTKQAFNQMAEAAKQKALVNNIVKVTGTLTNVTFGVTSLVNAIKTLENEDLSFMERFLQFSMGMSMALSMLAPLAVKGFGAIKAGATSSVLLQNIWNKAKNDGYNIDVRQSAQNALLSLQEQMIERQIQAEIVARGLKNQKIDEETMAEIRESAAQTVQNTLTKEGITLSTAEGVSSGTKTKALGKVTAARLKDIGAMIAQHWYIAAIAALLVGTIIVLNQASKAYNQEAEEADKAGEAAKRASEAFAEAQSEYDNFKNNLSAYQEASSAMDNLSKSTVEYREQLLKANEAAMELISSLNLIAGQDYIINSEGKIVFDETSYEEMQIKQLEKVQLANINFQRAQNQSQLETHDSNIVNYSRESDYTMDNNEFTMNAVNNMLGNATIGMGATIATAAAAGTTVGPIGTIVGALVGVLIGGIQTWIQAEEQNQLESDFQNAIFYLAESLDELTLSNLDSNQIATLLADYDSEIVEALQEDIEATRDLIATTQQQIEATKQAAAQEARHALWLNEENKDYRTMGDFDKQLLSNIVADRTAAILANEKSSEYQKVYEEVEKLWNDGEDDKKIYDEYLKAVYGEDEWQNYRITDDYGTHNTVQQKVKGSWENVGDENAVSNEEINKVITRSRILGKVLEEDEARLSELINLGTTLQKQNIASNYVEQIQMALSLGSEVDLSGLTKEQVNNLKVSDLGLSTDYEDALLDAKEKWTENAHLKRKEDEYQAALSKIAGQYEIDADTLDSYTKSILQNNEALEGNKQAALECAKQQILFTQGVEDLQKALDDNLRILEDWNKDAFETHRAATEVSKALEKMFGVRVNTNFVGTYLKDIKAAAEGDIQAIEKLSELTAKEYVAELAISEEDKNSINTLIEELSDKDIQIGAKVKVDNQDGIDAINKMLLAGEMTEEQMKAIFSAMNFTPDVEMVDSGKVQTSKNTTEQIRTKLDSEGNPIGTERWTDEITTHSHVMVPQIIADGSGKVKGKGSFTTTNTSSSLSKSLGSLKNYDADGSKNDGKIEDERDIFHDINVEIEKLTRNYDRLNKAREKMVGGDVVDTLNEELDLINQQNQAQRAKLEIAQQDAARRRNTLAGYGVQFNADGTVANYNDILNQYQAKANASGADKDKEAYEKLKKYLEEYEDLLLSEIPNIQNEITELMDAWVEANIEKFTLDINLGIELKDIKKEWRELQSEVFGGEDNPLSQFNNALQGFTDIFDGNGDNLFEDTMDRMNMFMEEYQKIKDGGVSDMFGTDAAAALEQIEDMRSQLFDMTSELLEYIEIIEESMNTLAEDISQTQDNIMSTYDMALAIIEHQRNVGNILYGDGFDTSELDEEEFQKRLDKITKEREEYIKTAEEANKLKDTLPDENDPEYNEKFRDYVEKAVDANEILSDLMGDVEETLELLNTILDNQMNKALDLFERTMTADAFEGWSTISDRWEKDQQLADVYLSTVNQEYEIQKLMNKINDDLLDKQYDSLYAQQAINKFKETELAMLMKKDKLTEAEVKRANQLYELTLLQIALEEARNNKSSMKLKRDSQGNYTYQYVADNEAIAKAEQDILDKQNEIYNESVENAIDNIERFNDAGANMQDQLQSLYESDNYQEYLGMLVNGETDSERFKELQGWLDESLGYIASDADYLMSSAQQSAIDNISNILKDAGFTDIDLNKLTDEQRKVLLSEGIDLQKLTALLNYNTQSVDDNLSILYNAINSSVDAYVKNTRLVMDTANTGEDTEVDYYDNLDLIKLNTDDLRLDLEEQKEKLKTELDEISKQYETEIKPLQKTLKDFFKDGGKFKNLMDDYTEDLNTNLEEIKQAINSGVTTLSSALGGYASAVTTAASQGNSGDSNNGNGGNQNPGGTKLATEPEESKKESEKASTPTYSNPFKKNDRVTYNNKNTYHVEAVEGNLVRINDYLNKNDSSKWVTVDELKDTKYDWKDLKHITARFWNTGSTKFKLVAMSSSGKYVVEATDPGLFSTYKKGERIWIDPFDKSSKAYQWYLSGKDDTGSGTMLRDWLKKKGYDKFDTGGYTGQWPNGSTNGRWALLHQKELILNEQDTPKILDAVKLVREMTTGSIISDMQKKMNNLISNLENDLIGTYVGLEAAAASVYTNGQALEQQVHIDATFPNVKDAKEIEAALNNLVNVASQYATEDK